MGRRSEETDRHAAEWAAKAAGGKLTPDERACLDAWRLADIRNAGAFARAEAVLVRLDRLRAVGTEAVRASVSASPSNTGDMPALASTDPQPPFMEALAINDGSAMPEAYQPAQASRHWTRRRVVGTGGSVALLAAAGVAGVMLWNGHVKPAGPLQPPTETFATRMGETRVVTLADGSIVTLNTNSRISVRYTEAARRIHLDQGEGLFKVAKNRARPFIVTASDTEVRAVGTSFTVSLLPKRPIRILVQEGVVEVTHRGSVKPIRAKAETQTLVAPATPIVVRAVPHPQISRQLAWRYGRIAFENQTLADAAEEFSRYSDTKIVIDPAVASRTITGLFASDDPVGFAKVTASILDLRVEVERNEVRIVR